MPYTFSEKINIGISACNFGAKIRWNRRGWDRVQSLEREKDAFIWTPVCPEIASGLGVPRSPVRLVSGNGEDAWQGKAKLKNREGKDVTEVMKKAAVDTLEVLKRSNIEAFVFMEGSPSCGVYRTTLKNQRLGKPPGLFGSLLLENDFFLIPALDIESPLKWWDWRRRLHAFVWLKRKKISTKKELTDIWHQYKFICQEVSIKESEKIGNQLANLKINFSFKFIDNWKKEVLLLLRKPSTQKRIQNIILKHYAYYYKHINTSAKKSLSIPNSTTGKHAFLVELQKMETRAINENFLFGGTPVIFRGGR